MPDFLTGLCEADNRFAFISSYLTENQIPFEVQDFGVGRNIVMSFGERPNWVILGHYDIAVPGIQGANDNSAAVAQLVDLSSRLYRAGYCGDLQIVLADLEEPSLYGMSVGAGYYARQLAFQPELVLVLDVSGFGSKLVMSLPTDGEMVYRFAGLLQKLEWEDWAIRHLPPSDDIGFSRAGIFSVLVSTMRPEDVDTIFPEFWSRFHSDRDDISSLDEPNQNWVPEILERLVLAFC